MHLTELIRQSFENELRKDYDTSRRARLARELTCAMHDREVPLPDQDVLLARVVTAYRSSGDTWWSAVLLEMLAPMLADAETSFAFTPRDVTREDLCQQLIVECLHAARFMKLPQPVRDIQGRLRRRTLKRTASWLRGGLRAEAECLEQVEREGTAYRDIDQTFLIELLDSGVSAESLAILYRSQVLGMTAREIAFETGISIDAVYMRRRRALRRLRHWSPVRFRRSADAIPTAA